MGKHICFENSALSCIVEKSRLHKKKIDETDLTKQREDFNILRDSQIGKQRIKDLLVKKERELASYLSPWLSLSRESEHVYPSQGLLFTPYDHLQYSSLQMLPQETIVKTLRLRRFFLEMFNHPYR